MTTDLALLNGEKFTEDEIKVFNEQYLVAMQSLANLTKQKKAIEEQEKNVKGQIEKVFEEYGIKSLDNEVLKITRVAAGKDSITIDLKEFEEKEPETYAEILADYPKKVKGRSGYIKFTVK